ncbi:MAG TPA: methyl-accepting chemotaxis protein [Bdellovibrionota bacterium]|nr:methyl-accepting chemotaxis protein [Bdellovibrionota bacterium]
MKNRSLNTKVFFVLGILASAAVAISYVGLNKMSGINDSLNQIVGVVAKRVLLAKNMDADKNELKNQEKVLILEDTQEGMQKIAGKLDGIAKRVEQTIADYKQLANDEGKKNADELARVIAQWRSVDEELRRLSFAGKSKEATALARGRARELMETFDSVLSGIVERNEKALQDEAARTDVEYTRARNMVLAVSILSILAGLLSAFFIMRAVGKAIDQVISSLRDNANQVTSAAQQIAASSEQLSQAATEQASSLEETSSSVEEMNSMIKKNSDNAAKAAEISCSSQQSASKGKEVVGEMLKAIGEINESNNQISEIVKVIAEIENKTKVINDIVFKTQLLSFNASVEAARAGAHGKGFAVVAEEVGKLAQLSGNAAREISDMLATSVQKVNGLVTTANEKVKVGTEVAQQCGTVLEDIVEGVTTLNRMASEIANASQEQAKGIEEVTRAMTQLDQVTQENAATSEESASAAEELSAQAVSLKGVVQVLIQTIKGGDENQQQQNTAAVASDHGARVSGPAVAKTHAKVLHIKNANSRKNSAGSGAHSNQSKLPEPLKKAVGGDYSSGNGVDTTSEDDPRFKDV